MSHLNTAYKLGSIQAQVEFEDWLRKQGQLQAGGPPNVNNLDKSVRVTRPPATKTPPPNVGNIQQRKDIGTQQPPATPSKFI